MNIKDIPIGESGDVILLIKSITEANGKNGKYQKVQVRDLSGTEFKMNHFNNLLVYDTPCIANAKIECVNFNGRAAYNLGECKPCKDEKISMDDFAPKGTADLTECWNDIASVLYKLPEGLKYLACKTIGDVSAFRKAPISAMGQYARQGGMIEATSKLIKLAGETAKNCNLNTDIMLAGASIYYVGYLDCVKEFTETKENVLYTAGILGYTRFENAVKSLTESEDEKVVKACAELRESDVDALGHILLSGFKGIPACTKEAVALRYLAAMLEELDAAASAEATIESGLVDTISPFTKKIYKFPLNNDNQDGGNGEEPLNA